MLIGAKCHHHVPILAAAATRTAVSVSARRKESKRTTEPKELADVSSCKRVAQTITPKKLWFKLLEVRENLWTPVSVESADFLSSKQVLFLHLKST